MSQSHQHQQDRQNGAAERLEAQRDMRARRARKVRRQFTVGVLVITAAVGSTVAWLTVATAETTGCAALAAGATEPVDQVALVVELMGNTERDASAAAEFASAQLETSAGNIEDDFAVSVTLLAYGEEVRLGGCLSEPRLLASPATDLDTYQDSSTSDDTKQHLAGILANRRTEQIGWLVDEISREVRQVPFTDEDPLAPELSPRLAWAAALSRDGARTTLAVMSPMISTLNDCFANDLAASTPTDADRLAGSTMSSQPDAASQVRDCLKFDQVDTAKSSTTSIVAFTDDLDAAQRRYANSVAAQMCRQLTTDRCSAMPDTSAREEG